MLQIGVALFYYKLGQPLVQIGANFITNWDITAAFDLTLIYTLDLIAFASRSIVTNNKAHISIVINLQL